MATDRYTSQQVADALTQAKGFVSVAARNLGCTDQTVRNYIERYAACKQAVTDAREAMIDYAEGNPNRNTNKKGRGWIRFSLKRQQRGGG